MSDTRGRLDRTHGPNANRVGPLRNRPCMLGSVHEGWAAEPTRSQCQLEAMM